MLDVYALVSNVGGKVSSVREEKHNQGNRDLNGTEIFRRQYGSGTGKAFFLTNLAFPLREFFYSIFFYFYYRSEIRQKTNRFSDLRIVDLRISHF